MLGVEYYSIISSPKSLNAASRNEKKLTIFPFYFSTRLRIPFTLNFLLSRRSVCLFTEPGVADRGGRKLGYIWCCDPAR